nr:hypothetical protein [Spirochaetales bacterium]
SVFRSERCDSSRKISKIIFGKTVFAQQAQILFNWVNMVRNGVVHYPSAWAHGGYNEIQNPPRRYTLIDREQLIACCGLGSDEQLRKVHRQWVEESIFNSNGVAREPEWTESIAVGSKSFVDGIRKQLQPRLTGRKVKEIGRHYELREQETAYNPHFTPENARLSTENMLYLGINVE